MKKLTIVAFALAGVLLIFSTVGGARAVMTYYSDTMYSQIWLQEIKVAFVENGSEIANSEDTKEGILLQNMVPEGEKFSLGKEYEERLAVKNTGTIDSYVRVTLYRYWLDQDGNKTRDISPEAIELAFTEGNGWIIDEKATTDERTVLYYTGLLPSGAVTTEFSSTFQISEKIASLINVETSEEGNIVSTYAYNGYRFVVEGIVDAVQDHNAEDAILSAWGKQVAVDETTHKLTLK